MHLPLAHMHLVTRCEWQVGKRLARLMFPRRTRAKQRSVYWRDISEPLRGLLGQDRLDYCLSSLCYMLPRARLTDGQNNSSNGIKLTQLTAVITLLPWYQQKRRLLAFPVFTDTHRVKTSIQTRTHDFFPTKSWRRNCTDPLNSQLVFHVLTPSFTPTYATHISCDVVSTRCASPARLWTRLIQSNWFSLRADFTSLFVCATCH